MIEVQLHGQQSLAYCQPLLLRFDQLLLQQQAMTLVETATPLSVSTE